MEDKKAHIITVATKLFAESGFDATSIRQIATAAEVNSAMISYYFGSKEGLLDAIKSVFREKVTRFLEEESPKLPPEAELEKVMGMYIGAVIDNYYISRTISIEDRIRCRKDHKTASYEFNRMLRDFFRSRIMQCNPHADAYQAFVFPVTLRATLLDVAVRPASILESFGFDPDTDLDQAQVRDFIKEKLYEYFSRQLGHLIT